MPMTQSTFLRFPLVSILAICSLLLHVQSPEAGSVPHPVSSFLPHRSSLGWLTTPIIRQPRLGGAWSAAFSPDGRLAATGHNSVVMVWRAATGDSVAKLEGFRSRVTGVAFDAGGEHLFTVDMRGLVLVWSTASWRVVDSLNRGYQNFYLQRMVITPDGRKVFFSGQDLPVTLWDRTTRQVTRLENYTATHATDSVGHAISGLDISADGSTLVSFGSYKFPDTALYPFHNVIEFWSVENAQLIRTFDRGVAGLRYEQNIALSPTMTRLAIPSTGNLIWYYDTETGTIVRAAKANAVVEAVRYSRDGSMIASVGLFDGLMLFDPESDNLIAHLPTDSAYNLCVAISPDGKRVIAGDYDGVVRIWSREDASVERERERGRETSLRYKRDGSAIVLEYELPRSSEARLVLCDLQGRELTMIAEGWMEEGRHTLRFDAGGIPSGLYLCAIRTPRGGATCKVPIER